MRAAIGVWVVATTLLWVNQSIADPGCVARGPFFGAETTDGVSLFAPGLASTQHHDDWPPVFSEDGREVVLRVVGNRGGIRIGTLFISRMDDAGCWSDPQPLPFSGRAMDGAAAFTPDGRALLFSSRRSAPGDPEGFDGSRIWVSRRRGESWTDPELLDSPVNLFDVDGGLSVDRDGNIFASIETATGTGGHDICLVRQVDGGYPVVEILPGAIDTESSEVAPFIDPDRRFLIHTSTNAGITELRVSLPDGKGGWTEGGPIPGLQGEHPKFAALSPDGRRLFFVGERSGADANPEAVWPVGGFDEPGFDDNADLFWMSSQSVIDLLGEDPRAWRPNIAVSALGKGLYRLTTDQGAYTTNSIAFVGDDGILLVDTQSESDAEALRRVVDGFHRGAPKIIIFTHRHVEHVGGAAIFGTTPLVIAHDLVRSKLKSGSYIFDEFPDATMPDLSFADRMKVFFNDEAIELVAMAGGHDDNEIIVHFTGAKVVHLSSLTNGFNFPSVDADGDVLAFAPLVARAIDELPEDVVIVSGHNDNGTWRDLQPYHDMLVGTVAAVRAGLEDGLDVDALEEADVLASWRGYAGSYVSTDDWIEYLAAALDETDDDTPSGDLYAVLYNTLRDEGVEAALETYLELKAERPGDFDFNEFTLLVAGNKLLVKERFAPASAFLELSAEEYPDGDYTYYAYYLLAQARLGLNQTREAVEACRKALDLEPDNPTIRALLAEIEAGPS